MFQGIFEGTISLLERNLDLRSLKHQVVTSNLANADTPGYKAFDLDVEKELNKQNGQGGTELRRTHPRHLTESPGKMGHVELLEVPPGDFPLRLDGNTVDMEREMAQLAENALLYKAYAKLISKQFAGLKEAIKGGR